MSIKKELWLVQHATVISLLYTLYIQYLVADLIREYSEILKGHTSQIIDF